METDRRLRRDERPNRRIYLAWLALSAIMVLAAMQRILQGQFPDPDDALRLVQVRDLLAGQSWFDTTQFRIDPPAGTKMHWSRLVDIPLLLVIGALTPLLGQATAETVALIAVPLLTFGATLWVIGRLAWRLLGPRVAVFACLACGFLPALLFQFQPMRIDHHGWQIFCTALALWAISWREPHRGGVVAGIAMAVGLTISIELLPLAAAFGGVLFLRWWRDRYDRWWLVAYMQALALGLAILFALTRGFGDLTQYCDAIAPGHIGFFVLAALGTGAVAWGTKAQRFALIALLAGVAVAALAFFALSAPTCLTTPFARLDPLVDTYWYRNVLEGQPLWMHKWSVLIPAAVQMGVALFAAAALMAKSLDWLRSWWAEYALLLISAIILAVFVARSLALASIIAAIPLGWMATQLLDRLRANPAPGAKTGIVVAFVLLLVPSAPILIWEKFAPKPERAVVSKVEESACEIRDQAAKLSALTDGTIFAPLDIGPAILLKSDHAVVATGHHRAEAAMGDVIRAFTRPPEEARGIIRGHGADYLVLCTDLAEPQLFAFDYPQGLAARLIEGSPPEWLEPVTIDAPKEFAVYRVR